MTGYSTSKRVVDLVTHVARFGGSPMDAYLGEQQRGVVGLLDRPMGPGERS